MKNILCYGDSNTWGFVSDTINFETMEMERFSRDIRWTGRLQKILGDNYLIIEEGLSGRTTNIDNPPAPEPDGANFNGKNYLAPCLFSHAPLDLVILMLGVNDFKTIFNRSAQQAAAGLEELIQIIRNSNYGPRMQTAPKILLVGYPIVDNRENLFFSMFEGAYQKSKVFPQLCAAVAEKYNCEYLDMSPHIKLNESDGLHFDEKAHKKFADLLAKKILTL